MKRYISVLILFFYLLFSVPVFAANGSVYELPELGCSVTIPSDYFVMLRDEPVPDTILDRLGKTREAVHDLFEQGIYLDAIPNDDLDDEIVVSSAPIDEDDFNSFSNHELKEFYESFKLNFYQSGLYVSEYDVYEHAQVKFIKANVSMRTDVIYVVYGLQYFTVLDGKAIYFTLRSGSEDFTEAQESMLKNIVDSVKFNHVPIALDSVEYTDSFIYFDFDSHAILHIPTNWDEKGLIKDNEFLDVKFASIRQKGCFILYGSTDIWEQLPDAEKTGRTRADINNQAFTEADIAEMYHIAADKVSVVTYDDIQYYQGENSVETDGLRVPVRQLVYIENGWVYTFQFGGIDSDLYVKDFEDLLDSVSYYRASNDSYDRDILAEPESPGINAVTIVVIILFLIVAGIIVVGVILCNKKTAVRPVQTNIGTPAPTVICCNCGKTLPEGNRFCHICGAEIKKKEHS